MDFVTPLLSLLGCLADYLFRKVAIAAHVDQNIDSLEAALEELFDVRDDLKKEVDRAELLGLTCTSQVKGWLARVDKVENEVRIIREDMEQNKRQCIRCCCTDCSLRCSIGKKVADAILLVNDLKGKGKLEVNLADGLLLVPVVEIPSRPAVGLELMLEKVGKLLRHENVGTVGIYGMGGVGKTTLLKSINNGFLTLDHDFEVVIWVVVSKDYVIEKIQQAIGVRLGLSWDETQFQELRASRIYNVMRKKKFLLLLDDLWEGLDLDKIGIPIPNQENESKVVFTTRSMQVCSYMDAHFKLKVDFLDELKSWHLFQEKVGGNEIINSPPIFNLAKTIVRKCGGLPLAIVSMGRAMANKRTKEEWIYAVEVLSKSPSEVRGMEDVFTLLKFSYDNLDNDILRYCLLYCSLFPEMYCIEKEQLIEYWAGEGFLDSLQDSNVQIMGHAIIGSLKVACFLETGEEESQVKMHDVVRSFALWILSEHSSAEKKFLMRASQGLLEAPSVDNWKRAERISLLDNGIITLTELPSCPNLSTLLLQWNKGLSKISDGFFQSMPVLKVLDLSFTSIRELPKSICKLVELRHLDLSGTKISTLPKELGYLTNLRHLNIQRNPYLRSIQREVISRLCQLRALNLYYSYSGWDVQDIRSSPEVRFTDLECLTDLVSLGITVNELSTLSSVSHSKFLQQRIQYLYIKECEGLQRLPISSYPGDADQLRRLSISNCWNLRYLEINEAAEETHSWLPSLEILALNGLPNLTSVWRNKVNRGCLQNLRCVNISYCHKLKNVSWILLLPNLEIIYIFYCEEMEDVVSEEEVREEDYFHAFPNLRVMSIRDVPELRSISRRAIFFPKLKNIAVINCPKLRKLPLKAIHVSELPTVYCDKEWWENLEWDDSGTKEAFLPHFMTA
ncbi:disease resistance protein RPS2-like [Primulina tabacum]|uniref:disease resistance protein RPS2-like n=1 Tax=Primulina tabacum TaxID=48773 RepID=UPI003F5A75C2